jgi:hypothetical protein
VERAHPIAVAFPARSEAIDALPGTKSSSPRVVPDEAKFFITYCASPVFAVSESLEVWHRCLLLIVSSLFAGYPFSMSRFMGCAFSNARSLGRSRSATQLSVGKHWASEGST